MPLGWIFIIALVVFILMILFFSWYAKFVAYRIFGRMNEIIGAIVTNGAVPAIWDKKLIKRLKNAKNDERKKKALEKHILYLEGEFKNYQNFAEKSSFIPDESQRAETLVALEEFKIEYIENLKEKFD